MWYFSNNTHLTDALSYMASAATKIQGYIKFPTTKKLKA